MRNRTRLTLGFVLLLAATLAAVAATAQEQDDEFRWTEVLSRGQTLEIKNANGPLLAELADGDQVEVVAIKEGPRRDREEVRIEVLEHEAGVTICALYTDGWLGASSCKPGDEGRIGTDTNDTEVTFRVKVPAGVVYRGLTMNGRIEADDLRSDADLRTMNGAIRVSTSGWARAETMNGAVEVRMGATDWSGDIEVSSMNGRIEVHLPGGADVDVEAATMNGKIDSDFSLERSGWIRSKAEGRIGDGGRRLELSTMNGKISIRRDSRDDG